MKLRTIRLLMIDQVMAVGDKMLQKLVLIITEVMGIIVFGGIAITTGHGHGIMDMAITGVTVITIIGILPIIMALIIPVGIDPMGTTAIMDILIIVMVIIITITTEGD